MVSELPPHIRIKHGQAYFEVSLLDEERSPLADVAPRSAQPTSARPRSIPVDSLELIRWFYEHYATPEWRRYEAEFFAARARLEAEHPRLHPRTRKDRPPAGQGEDRS